MIYICSYVVSTFLFALVENKNPKGYLYKLCVFFALLIPVCVAGLRHIGIGTDTKGYVDILYNAAINATGLEDYFATKVYANFTYVYITKWEIGYVILVYVVAKIFKSYQVLLAVTSILLVIPIYKGLLYFRDKIKVWIGMLVFYFMFYCSTLNLMRQWIAIAIVVYALHYLLENKNIKYLLAVIIAVFFHYSALVGIIIMLIYKFISSDDLKRKNLLGSTVAENKVLKFFLIIVAGFVVIAGISVLGRILNMVGLGRYTTLYLSGRVALKVNPIIRRAPIFVLILLNRRKLKRNPTIYYFFISIMVLDLFAIQLGSIATDAERIGLFFTAFYVYFLPYIVEQATGTHKKIYKIFLMVYLLIWFLYDIVLQGRSAVLPYQMFFN